MPVIMLSELLSSQLRVADSCVRSFVIARALACSLHLAHYHH